MLQAMDYIGQHYGDQNISVGEIAQHLGLSESLLSHLFRKETDYNLLNYLTRYRITRLWSCCGTAAPRCMRWPSGWAIGTSLTSPPHLKK